jgi:hypothetical protein
MDMINDKFADLRRQYREASEAHEAASNTYYALQRKFENVLREEAADQLGRVISIDGREAQRAS